MTTSIPIRGRFTIVDYRGFYDVPRLILAKDEQNVYWILESLFDDALDDYPDAYTVYPVELEEKSPLSILQRHHDDPPASALGTLPVSRLTFDPTTRASFEIV